MIMKALPNLDAYNKYVHCMRWRDVKSWLVLQQQVVDAKAAAQAAIKEASAACHNMAVVQAAAAAVHDQAAKRERSTTSVLNQAAQQERATTATVAVAEECIAATERTANEAKHHLNKMEKLIKRLT